MSTHEMDQMFQSQGGGIFAPSFGFKTIGDEVAGEIVAVEVQDQTDFTTGQPIIDPKSGSVKKQLKVTLQTSLRNWQGVSRMPTKRDEFGNDTGQPLPVSEDAGTRAVYVKGWMFGAVGDAVEKATGQRGAPREGGKLAVRFSGERPSNKGNPIKTYSAVYQAPAAGDALFQQGQQQAAAQPAQGASPAFQQAAAQQQAQGFTPSEGLTMEEAGRTPASEGSSPWGQQQAQPTSQDPWTSTAAPNF